MKRRGLILIVLMSLASTALAQSLQIIGGSSIARECFTLSQAAAIGGSANRFDLAVCNKAIDHGGLAKKDLVATYVNRGILHNAMKNYLGAAQDYNRAIKLNPKVGEAYMNRGNLWFMASHFKEAIDDYDKSLELGVGQAHIALLNKGMALESMGKLDDAKQTYTSAMQLVEDWPLAQSKLDRVNKKIESKKNVTD